MELQALEFESSLKSIYNFVQGVVSGQDENKKIKLVEELKKLLEMANNSNVAKKRSKSFDLKVPGKKIRVDYERVELPNEIWTKIMNYLPTKDIFKNFGLVSKRFHGLIGGIKYLQAKIIDRGRKC